MTTVYLHPILAACLTKAEKVLGPSPWIPTNDQQAELVRELPTLQAFIAGLPAGMLDSIGSLSADDINAFLRERGLNITVGPFGPNDFGCAAVLDILAKWTTPGHETTVVHGYQRYPAVEMTKGFSVLRTQAGEEVLQPHSEVDVRIVVSPNLAAGLDILRQPITASPDTFKGAIFPMVDYDEQVDISWLVNLARGDFWVSNAVAQAKLRMNEVGAHAKAGAAIVMTRSFGGPRVLRIDAPFTIAFLVAGQPAIAFHVTPEHWKKPPNLGTTPDGRSDRSW